MELKRPKVNGIELKYMQVNERKKISKVIYYVAR